MSDDLKNKGINDRTIINANETWEVNYWCLHLRCSPDELKNAVEKVGNSVESVREFLKTDKESK